MAGICEGRVVIVTGSGRGLGRAHALELARQGARVVVNDLGLRARRHRAAAPGPPARSSRRSGPAGGEAVANGDDVADFDGAGRMVAAAIEAFGGLDAVVNNAGFVRDRMFANAAEDEWDAVVRVHLKGHFAVARHAAAHWRDQAKAGDARRRPHHQHQLGRRASSARSARPPTPPPRPASPRSPSCRPPSSAATA